MTAKSSLFKSILLLLESILFFFYFYKANFVFLGVPGALHSIRIVAFIYFIIFLLGKQYVFDKRTYMAKSFKNVITLNLIIFVYCFLIILAIGSGKGRNITDDIINQIIFGFLMIYPLFSYFKTLDHFMNILLVVHILQSIVVWLCVLNPSISLLLDYTVNASELSDWYMERRSEYAGGIGCITSSGAIKFAFGLLACVYKYYMKPSVKYLALFVFFSVTICLIARTGLILCLIALIFLLIGSKRQNAFVKGTIAVLVIVGGLLIIPEVIDRNSKFYYDNFRRFDRFEEKNGLQSWVTDAYLSGDATVIPPLTTETMWGTTITSGTSGNGITVNVDGGYIRSYVALGLPLAIFFYLFVFWNCFKVAFKSKDVTRRILLLCTIFLIIGEFKEPFIFTITPWTMFYLIAFLSTSKLNKNTI